MQLCAPSGEVGDKATQAQARYCCKGRAAKQRTLWNKVVPVKRAAMSSLSCPHISPRHHGVQLSHDIRPDRGGVV